MFIYIDYECLNFNLWHADNKLNSFSVMWLCCKPVIFFQFKYSVMYIYQVTESNLVKRKKKPHSPYKSHGRIKRNQKWHADSKEKSEEHGAPQSQRKKSDARGWDQLAKSLHFVFEIEDLNSIFFRLSIKSKFVLWIKKDNP